MRQRWKLIVVQQQHKLLLVERCVIEWKVGMFIERQTPGRRSWQSRAGLQARCPHVHGLLVGKMDVWVDGWMSRWHRRIDCNVFRHQKSVVERTLAHWDVVHVNNEPSMRLSSSSQSVCLLYVYRCRHWMRSVNEKVGNVRTVETIALGCFHLPLSHPSFKSTCQPFPFRDMWTSKTFRPNIFHSSNTFVVHCSYHILVFLERCEGLGFRPETSHEDLNSCRAEW